MLIRFGAHLYGTDTPESDEDWRGVFVPDARDVLLGRVPKVWSATEGGAAKGAGEEDVELFSLHHFVRLACEGHTLAIDLVFAPDACVVRGPRANVWDALVAHRGRLLSKRMNAFVGYARSQAAKYSLKGERLTRLRAFADELEACDGDGPLDAAWERLPRDAERVNPNGIGELQIGGKWFGRTTPVRIALGAVRRAIARYGTRADAAAEGVDWKAMSHALRASLELEELLATGDLRFPLAEAELLRRIKGGEVELEAVRDALDGSLARVERAMAESSLPDEVDRAFWDRWLVHAMAAELGCRPG